MGETVTRMPDLPDDDAGIALWIAELRRRCEAGELLEEIPWTAEDEAASNAAWDELNVEMAREEHAAAIAQRRRERRRRRAWRTVQTG